eukprot:scaffold331881_cov18-Prasinocladus_malaysianus.AAC.1
MFWKYANRLPGMSAVAQSTLGPHSTYSYCVMTADEDPREPNEITNTVRYSYYLLRREQFGYSYSYRVADPLY